MNLFSPHMENFRQISQLLFLTLLIKKTIADFIINSFIPLYGKCQIDFVIGIYNTFNTKMKSLISFMLKQKERRKESSFFRRENPHSRLHAIKSWDFFTNNQISFIFNQILKYFLTVFETSFWYFWLKELSVILYSVDKFLDLTPEETFPREGWSLELCKNFDAAISKSLQG